MSQPVRIFIADDHRLVLDGLATLIESIAGLKLDGKFSNGVHLLDALKTANPLPDVCILDIEMPGMDGIETVKKIKQEFPEMKIMALTMHEETHFVNRMIFAGANCYLLKNVERHVFEDSIGRILNGEPFFTAGLDSSKSVGTEPDSLSLREKQILKLIAQGKNNKEIAEELFISDRTADTHRTNIKRKLNLTSLSDLIQYARDRGYLS